VTVLLQQSDEFVGDRSSPVCVHCWALWYQRQVTDDYERTSSRGVEAFIDIMTSAKCRLTLLTIKSVKFAGEMAVIVHLYS